MGFFDITNEQSLQINHTCVNHEPFHFCYKLSLTSFIDDSCVVDVCQLIRFHPNFNAEITLYLSRRLHSNSAQDTIFPTKGLLAGMRVKAKFPPLPPASTNLSMPLNLCLAKQKLCPALLLLQKQKARLFIVNA